MTKHIDMDGLKFGRLTVVSLHSKDKRGRKSWCCLCDCGNLKTVTGDNLRRGLTKSCGCLQKEKSSEASTTHGMTGTPTYIVWAGMIARCTDPNSSNWDRYGGAGITVCERWLSFDNFLADMGIRPNCMTLDREDGSQGYEPGNCRWASWETQANNTSRNCVLEFNGKRKTAAEWGRELKIPGYLVAQRIRRGWSPERALTPSIKES